MHDDLTFETFEAQFAEAYGRYLAGAPVEVDAVQMAATAASASRTGLADRLFRPAWAPRFDRRLALLAAVALLAIALVATALLIGTHVDQPPLGGRTLIFTNGDYDCQNAIRFDVDRGASTPIVACVNRLRLAHDGLRAAARGPNGIVIVDLRDGSIAEMASAPGSFSTPAAWSPGGNWLHWVSCAGAEGDCRGF